MKGKSLVGLTAVITGANSGIGQEMTRLLAAAGARWAARRSAPYQSFYLFLIPAHRPDYKEVIKSMRQPPKQGIWEERHV